MTLKSLDLASLKQHSVGAVCSTYSVVSIALCLTNIQSMAMGLLRSHGISVLQVPPQQVLVVHDDLDLPTGKVRLRAKGGHGGHNGMRSIVQHLKGSQDFPRLKIGIGRPSGQLPVSSFVLQASRQTSQAVQQQCCLEGFFVPVDCCLVCNTRRHFSCAVHVSLHAGKECN